MVKNKFDVYSKDEILFYEFKMLTFIKIKTNKQKNPQKQNKPPEYKKIPKNDLG